MTGIEINVKKHFYIFLHREAEKRKSYDWHRNKCKKHFLHNFLCITDCYSISSVKPIGAITKLTATFMLPPLHLTFYKSPKSTIFSVEP